jgi:hypothetical protein
MGTIVPLHKEQELWNIIDIPPYRTQKDAENLRVRCERIFRIKGGRQALVVTGRGEIISGFLSVESILSFYKTHRLISMISFTYDTVKLLTHASSE